MDTTGLDSHFVDLHLHTFASDGEMSGDNILDTAADLGLKKISITDHDGIGVYRPDEGRLAEKGLKLGIELITGIELDSEFNGVEVHILGYDINIHNNELLQHLEKTHFLRRKRIGEILDKVNLNFGKEVISKEDIFIEGRETLMKPHIVRELLKKNLFGSYKDASVWISQNCRVETKVPKLTSGEIVSIIKNAGGKSVIAHPGYYIRSGKIDLDIMITELLPCGIDGVEVFYDYFNLSPDVFTRSDHESMLEVIQRKTKKYGLFFTRGSDSHTLKEMRTRNAEVN